MLEHLELERCVIACAKAEISSRSLKVLHMTHCFHIYSLLICATNLTHISIIDPWCNSDPVVTRDLASLVTASIALSGCHIHNSVEKIVDHRLLDGLSHATKLELHAPSPEVRMGFYFSHPYKIRQILIACLVSSFLGFKLRHDLVFEPIVFSPICNFYSPS
jgi:hypothetical protein